MGEMSGGWPSHAVGDAKVPKGAFAYYRRLERVQRFVLEHLAEPISLSDAAGVAGMERTAFSGFFHRTTGICFRDWLAAVRIARAMEVMATRNVSIQGVARQVGFKNVRTFERVFKRLAGRTPIQHKISVRPP